MSRKRDRSLHRNPSGVYSKAETHHDGMAGALATAYMSHSEIAEVLGITRARVWQIEQRVMQKLRDALLRDDEICEWLDAKGILPRNSR